MGRRISFWTALGGASLFILLCSTRLAAPGLPHEEALTVAASFAYRGVESTEGCAFAWRGIPFLEEPDDGALKVTLYGLYLKFLNRDFGVLSLRLTGILFAGAGLFCLCFAACRRLSRRWLYIFLLLFCTDTAVLLFTRHDWGHVPINLGLRLFFFATWVYGITNTRTPLRNTFLLGLWAGFMVYQKLVNAVLLLPLLLLIIGDSGRRSWKHLFSALWGGLIGIFPLLFINVYSFMTDGSWASRNAIEPFRLDTSHAAFPSYLFRYLKLAEGWDLGLRNPVEIIIGEQEPSVVVGAEPFLLGALLLFSAVAIIVFRKRDIAFRMAGLMLVSYLAIGISLYFPYTEYPSRPYHWVIGTPFQYAAIAFTLDGIARCRPSFSFRIGSAFVLKAAMLLFAFIMIPRLIGLVSLQQLILAGHHAPSFDPMNTRFSQFAARRLDEALFFLVDWDLKTQVHCFSGGRSSGVYMYLSEQQMVRTDQVRERVLSAGKKTVYLAMPLLASESGDYPLFERIEGVMKRLPGWSEESPEMDLVEPGFRIRKFVRRV